MRVFDADGYECLDAYNNVPGHLMFTCRGSEANDLSLRLARAFWVGRAWGPGA